MHYRITFIFVTFICLFSFAATGVAQNANTDEESKPVILYSGVPKKYEIADIKVEGVKNYEDYVSSDYRDYLSDRLSPFPAMRLQGLSNVIGDTVCSLTYKSLPRKWKVVRFG